MELLKICYGIVYISGFIAFIWIILTGYTKKIYDANEIIIEHSNNGQINIRQTFWNRTGKIIFGPFSNAKKLEQQLEYIKDSFTSEGFQKIKHFLEKKKAEIT